MRSLLYSLALAFVPSLVWSQFLPGGSTPTAYHLKINASNLTASDTFSGGVLVNITVESSISSLLLHSENLTLNESSAVMMKKHFLTPLRWDVVNINSLDVNQTLLNISFSSPLAKGEYSFYIEYLGYYQSSMAGFAKVGYKFKDERKYLGVTGLEPTNARKVFPCYDRLGIKTQFTLELIVNRPYVAISNIRPTSIHNTSDTARVFLFKNYPQMSVSQLAWAVLDHTSYGMREDNTTSTLVHSRVPYLYLSQPINQIIWSNELTARLLEAVGKFTGLRFSETSKQNSSKIEQIVLPEFHIGSSGAYGFMSFSEESILVSPNVSSTRHMQDVALTLTRRVLQQWFGDIVSMDAWNNIWLMKGLQQLLQYTIAESMPEMSDWELRDQAVVELTQVALSLDSADSHPLAVNMDNEAELIASVSDRLTKYKGGAIMRMLKDVFGTSFNETVNVFITTSFQGLQPNPTTPFDIWNLFYELASENKIDLAQKSLAEIMNQWTTAPGYPVISVAVNTSHFTISQPNTSLWWVPVTYSLQGSPTINRAWLPPGSSFAVPTTSAKWILLNLNQTAYYRVNYTSALWGILSKQLITDLTVLPNLSRAQLLDDAFSLDPQMAVEMSGFLQAETDYFPWATALRHYQTLIYSMAGHSSYQLLQDYVLELMNGVIAQVGYSSKPQESHIERLKRAMVLEKACQFGHKKCIQEAVNSLRTWMAHTHYDRDVTPALLCAGVANSSTEVWHNIWSMYNESVVPSVRLAVLQSLTCTRNVDLLYQFLNNITSTSVHLVSAKDKTIVLETLSAKPFGAHTLLYWLVDRLQAQTNSSSTETSTSAPPSSTTETPTTPSTNTSETNQTTDQESSTVGPVLPVQERLQSVVMPYEKQLKSNVTTEKLLDSDVITILNLILPMLTTLEEGTKLETATRLGSATGLSNATLMTMNSATQRIYSQADKVMQLNAKLTTWLENEAASTSTTGGGSTNPSTQSPLPPRTTPSPSGANRLTFGTTIFTVCLLVFFLHTPTV